jgi:drug/metabolite transporter (DMT)-like permease
MGTLEWALLLFLGAIWGGSFFFFAIAVKELPVFTIVLARVAVASLALWLVVLLAGFPFPRDAATWRNFLIMGFLNNALPFSLIVWGQKEIAAGLAAVLNATTPFFTVLVAHLLTSSERLSWNKLAGALAGLLGVGFMMGADALSGFGQSLSHQLAFLTASLCYAFAGVFGKRFANLPPLVAAAGQTSGSSLLLIPLVLAIDSPWQLAPPSTGTIAALLGLALLCTSLAYVIYFTILKRAGATNISLVTFLVPLSAMMLGSLFLGETLTWRHGLGMAAVGLGLALIDGRITRLAKGTA